MKTPLTLLTSVTLSEAKSLLQTLHHTLPTSVTLNSRGTARGLCFIVVDITRRAPTIGCHPEGALFLSTARHIVPVLFREGRCATAAHPTAFEGEGSPPVGAARRCAASRRYFVAA